MVQQKKEACLSPTDPNVLRINKAFSASAGLPKGVTLNGQDLIDGIRAYMAGIHIPQSQLRHYMRGISEASKEFRAGLLQHLNEYFGFGVEVGIEDDETLKVINSILKEYKDKIYVPTDDTQDTRDLANTISQVIGVPVPIIRLSNKQIFVSVPQIVKLGKESKNEQMPTNSIEFIESSGSYPERTKENADWSDVTISFAADFNTLGEKATKRYAGSKFVPVKMFFGAGHEDPTVFINPGNEVDDASDILKVLKKQGLPTKDIKLNIAGNGIYTFKPGERELSQEEFNDYVTKTLQELQKLGVTISEIRSGGQTGADEAGIIAAQKLGIKASVNAPKGWKFRDSKGKDISDEVKFKERFDTTLKKPTSTKKAVGQKTLDDYEEEIKNAISSFSNTIQRGKGETAEEREADFAKNHIYYIKDKNGRLKKVDYSVTQYNEQLLGIPPYEGPDTPAASIGVTFDTFVRDYFSPSGNAAVYDNLSKNQIKELKAQLKLFQNALDAKFGIDERGNRRYRVITSEFPIGGYLTINGKKKSIAGTMDMLIVTDTGDIYIYDMKTSRYDTLKSETKKKYSGQLTFYKRILEVNFPKLAGRIKGTGLLLAHTQYATDYSNYSYNGNDVFYEGVPLAQSDADFSISIYYQNAEPSLRQAIVPVGSLNLVDELDISPLSFVEKKAIEDIPGEEDMLDIERALLDKTVENEKDDEYISSQLDKELSTREVIKPVSSKEIVFIGRNMVKMASWLCDRLSEDDSWRIVTGLDKFFKENQLVGMAPDEILKLGVDDKQFSVVWPALINYLKNFYFSGDDVIIDSEMDAKVTWIYNNFTDIVNTAFAELVSIEGIAVTGATPEYSDEIAEMFSMEAREEDGREAYFIDSRAQSYEASMPTKLKRKLAKIGNWKYDNNGKPLTDEDGNIIYNEDEWGYGIPTFLNRSEVINYLMHNLHYYKYASQMLNALKEQAKDLPWINQVVEMLEADPKLMTMFKVAFRKNETFYNKIYLDRSQKGQKILVSTPLNEKNKILELMDAVDSKVMNPEAIPPIYVYDKRDALGVFNVDDFILEEIKSDAKALKSKTGTPSNKIKALNRILNNLGIEGADNLGVFKTKALAPQFQQVIKSIDAIVRDLEKSNNKFTFGDKMSKAYYGLAAALTVAVPNTTEISSHDNDKNYMTYTDPSFIETLIDELSGKDPDYADVFDDPNSKYNHYRAFSYGSEENRTYVSSWLKRMSEDSSVREVLKHYVRTTTDDTPYLKQSDRQYWLSLIIDYFAPTTSKYFTARKDLRLFRVPTMSDKPAGESIQFIAESVIDPDDIENKYGLDEMKNAISDAAFEYFLYEIDRIKNVLRQLKSGDPRKDVDDYNISRTKEGAALREKLLTGKPLVVSDLFDEQFNLLPFLIKTGASFRYVPMFNHLGDMVVGKTGKETWKLSKAGDLILKALNGEKYSPSSLKAQFDKRYKAGMEDKYAEFRADLKRSVSDKDLQTNIAVMTSSELTEAYLQEYFWNDSLATMNIYNLTIVDPAYFKDNIALQKRFAQVHSSTIKADVEATFSKPDGTRQRFSDGAHRTIIIEDIFEDSTLANETRKIFKQREQEARRRGNIKEAQEYKILAETVPAYFKDFDSTDGQGFGSPTGFWKKLNMLGEYNPDFDKAMEEIRKGNFNIKNLQLCIQPFKPFMFGHVHKNGDTAEGIMEELVPMQIKDSEAMLYLAGAIMQGANWNHPLRALYNFMESTHYKYGTDMSLDTYSPMGIDTIVFHSAVKEGAFDVLDINGKTEEGIIEELEKAFLKDNEGNILLDSEGRPQYDYNVVKEMPFEAWGKQQNVPDHMKNHEQSMGSQIRILAVTDILDDVTVDHDPIIVKERKYGKREFLKDYFNLIKEDFYQGIEEAKRTLGLIGENGDKKLSDLLKNALVKDDKYSYQLYEAFDKIAQGKYEAAIGDPTIADKVYSTIFSIIKKKVNNEDTLGGPIVQVAPFGLSDNLHIFDSEGNVCDSKNFDANKGLIYEAYITAPSDEIENAITFSGKNYAKGLYKNGLSRRYLNGEILDIKDIINNEILTEEQLEFIAYRIPTEDKYSIYRMKIAGFLSRTAGETIIMPKEIVPLSGTDFDIDKMYIMRRYNLNKVSKELESSYKKLAEIKNEIKSQNLTDEDAEEYLITEMFNRLNSAERGAVSQERKNEIFEMQWAIMGHRSSIEKQLNPGNFDSLKKLAADVDPNYKVNDDSLMYAHNQVKMHRKNAAGKDFVGIAALNNVSHGIASFAELSFKDFAFDFKINGVTKKQLQDKDGHIKFDTVISLFDGSRISRTLGMFVGASADNAKEAVLGSINITPTTANIAMALFRLGIPLKTVVYMLSHPLIKQAAAVAENTDGRFEDVLYSTLNTIAKDQKLTQQTIDDITNTTNITDASLLEKIKSWDSEKIDNQDIALLSFLTNMIPYAEAISDLNVITSLNSIKNGVGPNIYSTIKKEYKIRRVFNNMEKENSLFSESIFELPNKVPFLKPLIDCYTTLLPQACKEFSPLYQPSFRQILDTLEAGGKIRVSSMDEKSMKRLLNFYLLFKVSKLGLIDTSYKGRKDLIYNFPVRFVKDKYLNLKDNELVQNINISPINKQVPMQALSIRLAGVGRERSDDLITNWDALLYDDAAAKLSDNLFAYMITRFGFTWNPTSATSLASPLAKQHFGKGKYQDIFVDSSLWGSLEIENFLVQYARNNPKSNLWINSKNYEIKEKDDIISIKVEDVDNEFDSAIGLNHRGNLYVKIDTRNPNRIVFKSVSKLGVQSKRGVPVLFELDATAKLEDAQSRTLTTVISRDHNDKQKEAMHLADGALIKNEYEEEDDEEGGDTTVSDNPTMERASRLISTISLEKEYSKIYNEVPVEVANAAIITADDTAYINFLQEIVDIISKNKQFKSTYNKLLQEVKDTIKELCK